MNASDLSCSRVRLQLAALLKKGREELEVVKRQSALSNMFKPNMGYVIENQKQA